MFRKALAILLVGSWVVLSAIDMLEDIDLANCLKIHAAESSDFARFGRGANVVNNLVENGTPHIVDGDRGLIIPHASENVGFKSHEKEAKRPKKNHEIYKLHSVFLI